MAKSQDVRMAGKMAKSRDGQRDGMLAQSRDVQRYGMMTNSHDVQMYCIGCMDCMMTNSRAVRLDRPMSPSILQSIRPWKMILFFSKGKHIFASTQASERAFPHPFKALQGMKQRKWSWPLAPSWSHPFPQMGPCPAVERGSRVLKCPQRQSSPLVLSFAFTVVKGKTYFRDGIDVSNSLWITVIIYVNRLIRLCLLI